LYLDTADFAGKLSAGALVATSARVPREFRKSNSEREQREAPIKKHLQGGLDDGVSDLFDNGDPAFANGSGLDRVATGPGLAGLLSNTGVQSGQIVSNIVQTTVGSGSSAAGPIGFMSDDGSTAPSLPHAVESAPVEAAATIVGATIGQVTTNADGSFSEAVSFAGSNVSFNNTFASGLSQAYINCALAAEQTIANNWNSIALVTLNEAFTAQAEGLTNTPLASNNFYYVKVSYAALKAALNF